MARGKLPAVIAASILQGMLVALPTFDPCAAVEPGAPDPVAAAAYLAVADAERAKGQVRTAGEAYLHAAQLDPKLEGARKGLEALCHQRQSAHQFDEGMAFMQEGDCAGAVQRFAQVRQWTADPAATLLEGVCRYQLEQDAQATALFEEARRDPALADTAAFYLGLLARRAGRSDEAGALLEQAARSSDPQLAASSGRVLGLTRQEGRLVASLFGETGYDTNVQQVPDGTAQPGGAGDASALAAGALLFRPLGPSGPFARVSGAYRKQLALSRYDLVALGAGAGWEATHHDLDGALEYGYDHALLGYAGYLGVHHLGARGAWTLGAASLHASYTARLERYLTADTADYSGVRHTAAVGADLLPTEVLRVGAAYRADRDGAKLASLAYWEHGPSLRLDVWPVARLTLTVTGSVLFRGYDQADPDLGVIRSDRALDGNLQATFVLGAGWSLDASLTARKTFSTVPDFAYAKFTGALGFTYTLGIL
jgi:tetratricopeptide (TPR) repeat protein